MKCVVAGWLMLFAPLAFAQTPAASIESPADMSRQIQELRALVLKLQDRIDQLESHQPKPALESTPPPSVLPAQASSPAEPTSAQSGSPLSNLMAGTTISTTLDLYYQYNFNSPIGRSNLLRAYDVSSNSFSLNQAAMVIENAPDPDKGKRYGARLDFQYGQATQTLQGSPTNELRPDLYRSVFQAYGTYVFPVNQGLTVDFGKWNSSLGMEGNYSKDQNQYSRSYWFAFLPYYHMGVRSAWKFSKDISFNYWLVNGAQQTEAFNNYRGQLFGFSGQPSSKLSWTGNYYLGREHPDIKFVPNSTDPRLPTLQLIPFVPIPNAPKGKLHIFDAYLTWNPTSDWSFSIEGDYVIQRLETYSSPTRTSGGAVYLKRQLSPHWAVSGRGEYLSDRGGYFSGTTQALKEVTLTAEYKVADGLIARGEYRRDFSNRPYFLTSEFEVLKKEQNTATLGLIWWFGPKKGGW